MDAFLATLSGWVPDCCDGEIVVGSRGNGDIASCGVPEDGVVDENVDIYERYRS